MKIVEHNINTHITRITINELDISYYNKSILLEVLLLTDIYRITYISPIHTNAVIAGALGCLLMGGPIGWFASTTVKGPNGHKLKIHLTKKEFIIVKVNITEYSILQPYIRKPISFLKILLIFIILWTIGFIYYN